MTNGGNEMLDDESEKRIILGLKWLREQLTEWRRRGAHGHLGLNFSFSAGTVHTVETNDRETIRDVKSFKP